MKNSLFYYSFLIFIHSASAQSAGNAIHQNPSSVGNSIGNTFGVLPEVRTESSPGSASSTTVKAEVMMNALASSYVAILSCTQAGETVIQTDSLMDVRLNNVFDETNFQAGNNEIVGQLFNGVATCNSHLLIRNPDLVRDTGKVIYLESFAPVERSPTSKEEVKLVIKF
jgi:hypothetical protein